MNSAQRSSVILGLILAAAVCLFPPWHNSDGAGYDFFLNPPKNSSEINFSRLTIQLAVVAILTVILVLAEAGRSDQNKNDPKPADKNA